MIWEIICISIALQYDDAWKGFKIWIGGYIALFMIFILLMFLSNTSGN